MSETIVSSGGERPTMAVLGGDGPEHEWQDDDREFSLDAQGEERCNHFRLTKACRFCDFADCRETVRLAAIGHMGARMAITESMEWLHDQNEAINFGLIDGNANPPVAYFWLVPQQNRDER